MPKQLTMQFDDEMPPMVDVKDRLGTTYFWWADYDKHKTGAEKILEGARSYLNKYSESPNICYCNHFDGGHLHEVAFDGVTVRVECVAHVQLNNFRIGRE